MAWLKLTHRDGTKCLVNSDQASQIYGCPGPGHSTAAIRIGDGFTAVDETVEEIAAMIERDVWRKRVLRVACAIMANERTAGLTSEQVWVLAVYFAAMDPERPQGG